MSEIWVLLHRPPVQRGIRAAVAAGLAWQVAVLLPPVLSDYAFYAPLGAVIAVHPTIADSANAAWRSVLAMLMGFALAYAVYEVTRPVPAALTIALIVALAIGVEQWRSLLRDQASWVSFAAVLMITVGAGEPGPYVLRYAGLTLIGAAIGVLVTFVLFPPLQLTQAVEHIARTRALLAAHLHDLADGLREGLLPEPDAWRDRDRLLDRQLVRMRTAETQVERARRANPRAHRWQGRAGEIRAESRAVDRVAVLVDDVTSLLAEFSPSRRGVDAAGAGTGWLLAEALDSLAAVVRTPRTGDGSSPDRLAEDVRRAIVALDRLVILLRSTTMSADEGFYALGAVAVGVRRSLAVLDLGVRQPVG